MFIMHVALQGCLRASEVPYGINADTGGHIRYLLELSRAVGRHPAVARQEIVTRAFRDRRLGRAHLAGIEPIDAATRIVRLRTASQAYLPKEALWREHDAFVDALVRHIERLDRPPDLIHAHYADAGRVAAAIRARLGIPYLFTAHSLGRVKRAILPAERRASPELDRRIAIEEEAILGASGIIASSRDEAELQYAGYDGADPGRIRIIVPGSDLAAFAAGRRDPAVEARLERFLRDPAKPVILAVARPVSRKNLPALVDAFGRSATLRARANLVVVAGSRDDIDALEPECARNVREIVELVDRHDLYGSVAYPKSHCPDEVPAIFAHAAARRGVFVNPALNEPFGLTLLEAAASGLPVVATDSGGPNDIVETCRNGILVDPHCRDGIASAIDSILADDALWDRYSSAGHAAVHAYDWTRHAAHYLRFAHEIAAPPPPPPVAPQLLLVSDIDNTLVGCVESTRCFAEWHAGQPDILFGIATGRSLHSALSILAQANAPRPQIIISSVGSEIYRLAGNGAVYAADTEWAERIAHRWDAERVGRLIAAAGGVTRQGPLEQRRFKLSYFTGGDPGAASRIGALLADAGHSCQVIQSHGRYLDVLPLGVSKGSAVEHVRRRLGFARDQVIVAGDSGNDVEMLRAVPQAIIVANYTDGLAHRPDLAHTYVASSSFARGVIEGVDHFRGVRRPAVDA